MATELILVLTMTRSGSSNFINMLRNNKNIDVNGEIFNRRKMFLNERNKKIVEKIYGNRYFENIHKNKKYIEVLELLKHKCNKKYIIFKILFSQYYTIKQHIGTQLFDKIIILERKNILDRYISSKKCKITENYYKIDTSNLKIHFNKIEYLLFKKKHYNNFKKYNNDCKNKDFINITYTKKINIEKFCLEMNNFLPNLYLIISDIKQLPIQDKESNYKNKLHHYWLYKKFITKEINSFSGDSD